MTVKQKLMCDPVCVCVCSPVTLGCSLLVTVRAEGGAVLLHLLNFKPCKDLLRVSDDVGEGWTELGVHLKEDEGDEDVNRKTTDRQRLERMEGANIGSTSREPQNF